MKSRLAVAIVGFSLSFAIRAQDAAVSAGTTVGFEFGATVNAVLSDAVDARRSKPGDLVRARMSEDLKAGGGLIIPRGSRLIGHVSDARPTTRRGAQSRLGLMFDRVELKDGRKFPLRGTLLALAAAEGAAEDDSSPGGGFGGALGGGSSAVQDMAGRGSSDDVSALGTGGSRHEELKPSPGAIGGLNRSGRLFGSSRGIFGLVDISLEPGSSPGSGSSAVLGEERDVRLSGGTRMLLAVEAAEPAH